MGQVSLLQIRQHAGDWAEKILQKLRLAPGPQRREQGRALGGRADNEVPAFARRQLTRAMCNRRDEVWYCCSRQRGECPGASRPSSRNRDGHQICFTRRFAMGRIGGQRRGNAGKHFIESDAVCSADKAGT